MMPLAKTTVEVFFQKANWQGLGIIQENESISIGDRQSKSNLPQLTLTVKEYFSAHNWQGLTIQEDITSPETVDLSSEAYCLTMSVSEFFNKMVWQAQNPPKRNIAAPPNITETKTSNFATKKQLNLQDLSDLM